MISRQGRLITQREREAYRQRDERLSYEETFMVPSLTSIQAHLNISHNEDDEHLVTLSERAISYFEQVTGHHIRRQKREVEYSGPAQAYQVPHTPWVSLDGLEKYDEGTSETLDPADYYVEEGPPAYVKAKTGTSTTSATSVVIQYTVGYAKADDVPDAVEHALQVMIADLYEFRTSAPITGQSLEEVPFEWETLIDPFQVITF